MKKLIIFFFLSLLSAGLAQMAPQPTPKIEHLQGDEYLFRWEGLPGRVYFIQVSSQVNSSGDFVWEYIPDIRLGRGEELAMGIQAGAENAEFFRLVCTDPVGNQDPNLADYDNDGFTNLEEVNENTNPLDPNSRPAGAGGGGTTGGTNNNSEGANQPNTNNSNNEYAGPPNEPWAYTLTFEKDIDKEEEENEEAKNEEAKNGKGETVTISPSRRVGRYLYDRELGLITRLTFEDLIGENSVTFLQLEPDDKSDKWKVIKVVELSAKNPKWEYNKPPLGTAPKGYLLPVEVRDVNGAGEADDVTITPWDTSQDIANNNIAWIDAHQSAQNAAPRMPQLEFRVPGLPDGLTIEAKLNVQYTRGNDPAHGRAHLTRAEDRVRIPADGNFTQVNGDTWQLYSEADWQTELTERGFFGGKATLTYQFKRGADVVVGPEEINFRIGGENPDDARCRTYIESRPNAGPDGNLWFAYAIAKSESRDYNGGGSRYNQFLELPNHRRDVGRPLFGDDRDSRNRPVGPGGYGMFQITGNVNDHNVDIPRRQYWNWQDQINAAIPILASKRAIADRWMNNEALRLGTNIPDGQRPQARRDRGVNVPVPNRTVRGILFSDDANSDRVGPIEDAVAIKAYNSANPHYCSWGGNAAGWRFNNTNGSGFDYVDRVCQEVENDE